MAVTGAGSTWSNSGTINVGATGAGSMTVQSGGAVTSGEGHIGRWTGSTGSVLVSGVGSSWSSTDGIHLGYAGRGMLTIQNGATVTSSRGTIGGFENGRGSASVSGAGSQWNMTGDMHVGERARGLLEISAGGTLTNHNGRVGGSVTVRDETSAWHNSGELFIGDAAGATVSVFDGAALFSAGAVVDAGSTARIRGGESRWGNAGDLHVMELSHVLVEYGSLTSEDIRVGRGSELAVTGAGAKLAVNDLLHVGHYRQASFWAEGDSRISTGRINVGDESSITIRGGVQWDNAGYTAVSGSGSFFDIDHSSRLNTGQLSVWNNAMVNLRGGVLDLRGEDVVLSDGAFTFTSGTLRNVGVFRGDLEQQGGLLQVGEGPGVMSVEYYSLTSGALELELFGTGGVAGVDHDQLEITNNASVYGRLNILMAEGLVPQEHDEFQIFKVRSPWSLDGRFGNINLPTLSSGLVWDLSRLYTEGIIAVADPGILGDFDGDGTVDQSDLTLVLASWGTTARPEGWSGLFDGNVDQNELSDLLSNWGYGMASSSAAASVPEPASLILLGLGGVALLRRRG